VHAEPTINCCRRALQVSLLTNTVHGNRSPSITGCVRCIAIIDLYQLRFSTNDGFPKFAIHIHGHPVSLQNKRHLFFSKKLEVDAEDRLQRYYIALFKEQGV
jgi:hypothetical protein